MNRVPLIDIQPFLHGSDTQKEEVARQLDRTCRDLGFLLITGHGVPAKLRAAFESAMMSFFSLPAEIKRSWAATPDNVRGYRGMNATALSKSRDQDSPPDLMERFTIGQVDIPDDAYHNSRRRTYFQENRWPELIPAVEVAACGYYREMERLAAALMRLLARALQLPERHFEPYFDKHVSVLVTNFYPPQPEAPMPGQLRAGAHTDYGSLTILAPSVSPGGLQVCNRQGLWEEIPHFEGAFVVNLGDLMAQWTNDRWSSTMHRVVNPERESAEKARMSIVFFQQPNEDALISCLPTCLDADHPAKYAPVSAGEYVSAKLHKGWIANKQSSAQNSR
ncbi:MAG TPA: 2-oxoglutarate and iron-dependent oxygenase domain-containing protein [Xanthobacteraceae bacterium]|jgi:isopenicillin N synthase-like dioxygenase